MKKNNIYIVCIFIYVMFFTSCAGDCKVEEIEKVEWETNFVKYSIDTFANYSIIEEKIESGSVGNNIEYSITIKNENKKYSNKFAVTKNNSFIDSYNENEEQSYTTDFIEIFPGLTYTFTFYNYTGYNYHFNNSIKIIQIPKL